MIGSNTKETEKDQPGDESLRVFVYGTLKRGGGLHGHLTSSKFLGEFFISGFSMFSNGGFPVIRPSGEDNFIFGEVYEVSRDVLAALDRAEGVAYGMYRRDVVSLYDGTTDVPTAFVYVGPEAFWDFSKLPPVLPKKHKDTDARIYEWEN